MADVQKVADFFIEAAASQRDYVTNLKLNKLLYFAQVLSLVRRNEPLFSDPIEAWDLGPVVSSIYHSYKGNKNKPIKSASSDCYQEFLDEDEQEILVETMLTFGQYTATALVNKTHVKGGPWETSYGTNNVISIEAMRDYYMSRLDNSGKTCKYNGIDVVVPRRGHNGKALLPSDVFNEW